jgi:hypothetical protein
MTRTAFCPTRLSHTVRLIVVALVACCAGCKREPVQYYVVAIGSSSGTSRIDLGHRGDVIDFIVFSQIFSGAINQGYISISAGGPQGGNSVLRAELSTPSGKKRLLGSQKAFQYDDGVLVREVPVEGTVEQLQSYLNRASGPRTMDGWLQWLKAPNNDSSGNKGK